MHNFPQSNILGVGFNDGGIDLYINGDLVTTYTGQHPSTCRRAGFIVGEGQIDIVVDNVFAY